MAVLARQSCIHFIEVGFDVLGFVEIFVFIVGFFVGLLVELFPKRKQLSLSAISGSYPGFPDN